MLRRMRRRVLVAWLAQGALVLGLVVTMATAAGIGMEDWSFIAVMIILTTVGLAVWVRFSFGIPLLVADLVYLLMGIGLMTTTPIAGDPGLGARPLVSILWVAGGLAGVVAIVASTRASGDPRDDIDSTAY